MPPESGRWGALAPPADSLQLGEEGTWPVVHTGAGGSLCLIHWHFWVGGISHGGTACPDALTSWHS